MPVDRRIEVLVRFARLASEANSSAATLPQLADELVTYVGASAVAIVEINDSGACFIPSQHLPPELEGFDIDIDAIGDELGAQLLERCGKRFQSVISRPLVSGGGLFGTVVLFFTAEPKPANLPLADGLIDLCAVSLEHATHLHQLAESNAQLRASQEALTRTEKLRALGQMAAGVSHDLKNILNPLSLHLQLIDRAVDKKNLEGIREASREMKQVLTRGVQTIERLRDYSRQSPESRAALIDLDLLAHEAAEIAKPRMASRRAALSSIKEELGNPPKVLGRSGDVVSALVNLVVNAIDAMPNGGIITLRTGSSVDTCWVKVTDNGPGMPPDVERRAFEPFFTTKGEDGTGLGLAMVYACMQRHGGSVKLETAAGKGTTFTLSFPRAPGSAK